jgi:hypothetical protein
LQKSIHLLKEFQKIGWDDIITDLSDHVTNIYERDDILTAVLLTYFSPLRIMFNDNIIRGWMLSIIIGDSGHGKTQTYTRISEYIDVGDFFSCLTGSRTGLAYAMVDSQTRGWQVKIGRYPANSRKLLVVDETQHLDIDDLQAISKAMDEGFLQIDRVKSKGYESMTRMIMMCNPKYDKVMDSEMFGCETLKKIFRPTIIRRVDFAVFANASDIDDLSFINKRKAKKTQRKISPEMLRAAVYWVWNLNAKDIVFDEDAVDYCLEQTNVMSKVFGHAIDIPLVPPADFRHTLARLATGFACILMSANDDFSKLHVRKEHIIMSINFLKTIYEHENCGLDEYSEIKRLSNDLHDYQILKDAFIAKKDRGKHSDGGENYFLKFIFALRINSSIRRDDLVEQVGCDKSTMTKYIQFLRKYNLIESGKNGYVKKGRFNKFLRKFLKEKPDFLKNNPKNDEEDGFFC